MRESYITFETAKLAKSKGFFVNNKNTKMYKPDGKIATKAMDYMRYELYSKVTQSVLQRWLMEEFGIDVHPYLVESLSNGKHKVQDLRDREYACRVYKYGIPHDYSFSFDTNKNYNKAFEEGLQRGLKMIE